MAHHSISVSALIDSPSDRLYRIIADYRNGHPYIIPKPPFVSLTVEEGGVGAGTVIFVQMKLLGRLQEFRANVTEPEPGRVLVETDPDSGLVTTFIVEPRDSGQRAYVTIATQMKVRDGILGKLQGLLATKLLHPVYVKELKQLSDFARSRIKG
jgi:Polyketide cyclase / dehydrase and lipid transport